MKWQPTVFIFWKSLTKENEQLNILHNALNTSILYFDSTIFVYFFENDTTNSSPLKIVVWEAYSIKHKRVYTIVKSFYTKEMVIESDNAKSAKSTAQISTLNEELESFAKRRRNFHLESLVASVKVLDLRIYLFNSSYIEIVRSWIFVSVWPTLYWLGSSYRLGWRCVQNYRWLCCEVVLGSQVFDEF